jgi:hypothetical protein
MKGTTKESGANDELPRLAGVPVPVPVRPVRVRSRLTTSEVR